MMLLFIIWSMILSPVHDIHVSVCDIDQKKDRIEVTLKIFFDDLQNSMGLTPGEELPEGYKGSDALIKEFIKKHFTISINGADQSWEYQESMLSGEAVWTTLHLTSYPTDIKEVGVRSSILIDLFSDQANIVNCSVFGTRQTEALNRKKETIVFTK